MSAVPVYPLTTRRTADAGDVPQRPRPPLPTSALYPIVKFGARWVCDGPDGRFHTRTRAEAERLLSEAIGAGFDLRRGAEILAQRIQP